MLHNQNLLLVQKDLCLGDLLIHRFKDLLEGTGRGGQYAITFLLWGGGAGKVLLLHSWVERAYLPQEVRTECEVPGSGYSKSVLRDWTRLEQMPSGCKSVWQHWFSIKLCQSLPAKDLAHYCSWRLLLNLQCLSCSRFYPSQQKFSHNSEQCFWTSGACQKKFVLSSSLLEKSFLSHNYSELIGTAI